MQILSPERHHSSTMILQTDLAAAGVTAVEPLIKCAR